MSRFYRALEAKYQAQLEEGLAVFELYSTKSVGVGEHSDILSILDAALASVDEAVSKIETLRRIVSPPEAQAVPQQEEVAE